MADEKWAFIKRVGETSLDYLVGLSPEDRKRLLSTVKDGVPPPKSYGQGWAEGRTYQEAIIIQHLHARGFCDAAKALESPGFYGSFGMTGGDGFSEEAFNATHECFKKKEG